VKRLAPVGLAAAALGCGGEPALPEVPTWAQHVQPILRANCFHCHGATASYKAYGTLRWDVYDLSEAPYQRMGFAKVFEEVTVDGKVDQVATFFGATEEGHPRLVNTLCDSTAPDDLRMPPLPATPLSAHERQVLDRWANLLVTRSVPVAMLKGSHEPNHQPTLTWLQSPTELAVRDEDGDQVLGKLDCQGVELRILHTGGWTLPAGARPPCRGTLYDGYEEQAVTLE
jgi:hypothetical protein